MNALTNEKFKGEMKIHVLLLFAFYSSSRSHQKIHKYDLYSFARKRYDPYIENRSVTISATRREQVMIVRLAVRVTLPLEEVPRAQLLVAVSACEVFRMPRLAQGRYHLCSKNIIRSRRIIQPPEIVQAFGNHDAADGYLAHDGLLAGVAASLLGRVDTLAAHVGLEIAEHRIQLVLLERLALSRMIEMSRVGLGNVDTGLRALGGQRTLRALGGLVGLRVRGVGHRLMLMGAAVNLKIHADRRVGRVKNPSDNSLSEKSRLNPKCERRKKFPQER